MRSSSKQKETFEINKKPNSDLFHNLPQYMNNFNQQNDAIGQ